jgi:glucose/arabinose dehydrogenase
VDELVQTGFAGPSSLLFLPDGRLLVGEQGGSIRVIQDGELLSQPFLQLEVTTYREQGLLGMALEPGFPYPPYLYLVYTPFTGQNTENHHLVSRFTVDGDVILAASEVVLFDEIPTGSGYHVGGCIRIAPDGNLLIGTGDTSWRPPWPRDLTRLEGKLLRLRRDGGIPADNPFVAQPANRPEIWQFGLRNPFRFCIQPGTGAVFIGDVGAGNFEEVNVGPAGSDFGWPRYEGPEPTPDSTTVDPLWAYPHDSGYASIVGSAFYQGRDWPADCVGNLFFLDHSLGTLGRIVLGAGNSVESAEREWAHTAASGNGFGPVDLIEGPDGALYYSTYDGQVRRIRYAGDANRRPEAVAVATPSCGYAPHVVTFDGSASFDVDGDSLDYEWDFGDGSSGAGMHASHTYLSNGAFTARLTVRDGRGAMHVAPPSRISVGDLPPIVTITSPPFGSRFAPDEPILFAGSASDPENGIVPDSSLHWRVSLHHAGHLHPVIIDQAGAGGSFTGTFHSQDPREFFYRVTAWVLDASGLRGEQSVDVFPNGQPPGGIVRSYAVPGDDRDATSVRDTVRVSGYSAGKPIDYVTQDDERCASALQFALDLPGDAVVLEARILVRAGPVQNASPSGAMQIQAYDVGDCPPFVNGAFIGLLEHAPTFPLVVTWMDSVDWQPETTIQSPDLGVLVSAFLGRADYQPGNHLGIVVSAGTLETGSFYGWTDFTAGGTPARLLVRYTVPAGLENEARNAAPRTTRLAAFPNPFNPPTRLEFTLESPGRALLEVFDVAGHRIRRLIDLHLPAGTHHQVWDGRDDARRSVPSGVYFARVTVPGGAGVWRLVLAR